MGETFVRAPTLADVDAVVELLNRESRRLRGRDTVDATTVRGWWTQPPPFDLEAQMVVAEREGRLVGYADLGDRANDGSELWLDVRGDEVGEVLVEIERRALARRAPDGVVRAVVDERDEGLRTLLADRGYAPIRASFRMAIDLAERAFDPAWPAGCGVRTASIGEEALLHDLAERSFADHWGFRPTPYAEWLHWLREMGEPDPSLWFVAEDGDEPVGVALCRPAESGDPACGWVSTLGVLPAARRRGIALALLTHAFSAFRARGLERAALGVDGESTTGAIELYLRAGMHVVERHDTWELRR